MKKRLVALIALVLTLMACGQTNKPPQKVQSAFSEKFTSVKSLKWEKENNGWEAEFKMNDMKMSASFTEAGEWLETETEIKTKDVPADIINAVKSKFVGWNIDEVEKLEKPDFKGYEVDLKMKKSEKEILVSETGEITINNENEEGEKDED